MSFMKMLSKFQKKDIEIEISSPAIGEMVLSDGRFVTMHRLTAGHYALASDENQVLMAAKLIAISCKIDGVAPSFETVLSMDIKDFSAITTRLIK